MAHSLATASLLVMSLLALGGTPAAFAQGVAGAESARVSSWSAEAGDDGVQDASSILFATEETPSSEPPATDAPGTESPTPEPDGTEPPATEPPATEPPATDPPATEPPTTDPPTTEPPSTDVPSTDPPTTGTPTPEPSGSSTPTPPPATPGLPTVTPEIPGSTPAATAPGAERTSLSADTAASVAKLLVLRQRIDSGRVAITTAEKAYDAGQTARTTGLDRARRLDRDAATALKQSQQAAGTYVRMLREGLTAPGTLDVLFAADDASLLHDLASADRLARLSEHPASVSERVVAYREESKNLTARAEQTRTAANEIPLDQLAAAVNDAHKNVTDLEDQLAEVTAIESASSQVRAFANLPTDAGQLSEQGWALPTRGRISDGYGLRPNRPLPDVNEFHSGTDVAAPCGTPIYAATAGTVVQAQPEGTLGNWIMIDHGSGISTGYGHIANGGTAVAVGAQVQAGQVIAIVGSTGASTGCHLHFEVHIDGVAIDSVPFLAARGVALGG
ncbi:M23 family metallopeptidase [Compostimonas suwonensis]|uniref:Murein DD-endopeptidase MepM/ murein hydrolase activator NlpD n=1 Tax=Compostimonas suwonensis TaxID=1048394 RepID=A0A2M9C3Q0_9MICO|nr:M23 family metallopeptidase [Compostimonas suwonensis]PJJ65160.1 murein DD-endopeptidase MepM/ murein hydrolase activator NlpD [Compostimonas suwonensis]